MIKKTSWIYVLLSPQRWKEIINYIQYTPPVLGAGDRPDPRDRDASELFSGVHDRVLPSKTGNLELARKAGWTPVAQSLNSCTAYSKGYAVEITNSIEDGKSVYIDKELQWSHQEKTGASRKNGDFIQNAEKQFHENPQGFHQTEFWRMRNNENTVNGSRKWLVIGIGSNIRTGIYWKWSSEHGMTNSTYMKKTGFFIPGDGKILGGHACTIVDYNDEIVAPDGSIGAFKLIEPGLEQWGNNLPGEFWVSYKYFNRLFSKYVSRDEINHKPT